jgi:hypothetical protein
MYFVLCLHFADMASFSCHHCHENFFSLVQAIDHVHSHQQVIPKHQKPCVVSGCGETISRLSKHIRKSHPNLCKFPCDLCERAFVRDRDMQMHKKNFDCQKRKKKERNKPKKKKATITYPAGKKYEFCERI